MKKTGTILSIRDLALLKSNPEKYYEKQLNKSYSHKPHLADLPGDHRIKDEELSKKRLSKLIEKINKNELDILKNDYLPFELEEYIDNTEKAIKHLQDIQEGKVEDIDPSPIHENSIHYLEDRLKNLKKDYKRLHNKEKEILDYYDDFKKTCEDLGIDDHETDLYGKTHREIRLYDGYPETRMIPNVNGTYSLLKYDESRKKWIIYNQYGFDENTGLFDKVPCVIQNGNPITDIAQRNTAYRHDNPSSHDVSLPENYDWDLSYSSSDNPVGVYHSEGSVRSDSFASRMNLYYVSYTPKADDYVNLPDGTLRPVVASDEFEGKGNHYTEDIDGKKRTVHFMGSGWGPWFEKYTDIG